MTTVTLKIKPKVQIAIQNKGGVLSPINTAYVLGNQGAASVTPTSVAAISDVNVNATPADTSTLVYNANTHLYDVKPLPVDGGSF